MTTKTSSGLMRLLGLGVLLAWCPAALADGHSVPLFLSQSDGMSRQGFVRVINHSDAAGMITIIATDDAGDERDPVTLSLGARAATHFNSDDLEMNAGNKLSGSVGAPSMGFWRLDIDTELEDVEVWAYVRTTSDGFLTSMHDTVPANNPDADMKVYHVRIFNPARNPNQISWLRLVNPTESAAAVTIRGLDDAGMVGAEDVSLTLPAGQARMLTATNLEQGDADGLAGGLTAGAGKWRLFVTADQPIWVMSLMSTPTGHMTNLSTPTAAGDRPPPARPEPPAPPSGEDEYATMCEGISVEAGQISYGPLNDDPGGLGSLTDCATSHPLIQPINELLNPIDQSTATIHEAKWQMRADANSAWMDIAGTTVEFDVCPYDPEGTAGEYRLVVDQTITPDGGEPNRFKCSSNSFTVE